MSEDLDKLERDVERQMRLLAELPPEPLDHACLHRVKTAVVAEAARLSHARRRVRVLRGSLAAVAAVLIGAAAWTLWPDAPPAAERDADALLDEWVAALDESQSQVALLLDGSWSPIDAPAGSDEDAELDEWLRSLDQSLERFEEL